jgi:myo-inositol-1(or 4)-monophosphatase
MSSPESEPVASPLPEELLELAESAARIGGDLARASFGQPQRVTLKGDRSEVTEVDLAVERTIGAHIHALRPHDTFIGEEAVAARHERTGAGHLSAIRNPQSAICWVIDPIDGTRNYIRNLPWFTCSVAAMQRGEPVAGAIFDPMRNVMYSAPRAGGMRVDGRPVSPSDASTESVYGPRAKLIIGIPSARRKATRALVLHALEHHVVRNFGSAALHLALTALGQLDLALAGNVKLWDIAAGCLLVEEAGGVVTSPAGAPIFPLDVSRYGGETIPVIAGSSLAHARLMRGVGKT